MRWTWYGNWGIPAAEPEGDIDGDVAGTFLGGDGDCMAFNLSRGLISAQSKLPARQDRLGNQRERLRHIADVESMRRYKSSILCARSSGEAWGYDILASEVALIQ